MRVREAVEGAGAVAFEGEEVFAGPEDRLDPLTDRRQVRAVGRVRLCGGAGRSWRRVRRRRVRTRGRRSPCRRSRSGGRGARQRSSSARQTSRSEAFGRGERERAWGAVEREQAVQAEAPEVAAVAGAVAVVGGVGELAAPRSSRSLRAHSTGVESTSTRSSWKPGLSRANTAINASIVSASRCAALVVARPLRQHREQVRELLARRPAGTARRRGSP